MEWWRWKWSESKRASEREWNWTDDVEIEHPANHSNAWIRCLNPMFALFLYIHINFSCLFLYFSSCFDALALFRCDGIEFLFSISCDIVMHIRDVQYFKALCSLFLLSIWCAPFYVKSLQTFPSYTHVQHIRIRICKRDTHSGGGREKERNSEAIEAKYDTPNQKRKR